MVEIVIGLHSSCNCIYVRSVSLLDLFCIITVSLSTGHSGCFCFFFQPDCQMNELWLCLSNPDLPVTMSE